MIYLNIVRFSRLHIDVKGVMLMDGFMQHVYISCRAPAYICIRQGSMVGCETQVRNTILLDDSCFQTLPNTNISALRNATSSEGYAHLERCLGYGHMRNVRVQFFFCVFLIVAFTYKKPRNDPIISAAHKIKEENSTHVRA